MMEPEYAGIKWVKNGGTLKPWPLILTSTCVLCILRSIVVVLLWLREALPKFFQASMFSDLEQSLPPSWAYCSPAKLCSAQREDCTKTSTMWSALLNTSSKFCLRDRCRVVKCWIEKTWLGILALSVGYWLILDMLVIFLKLTCFTYKIGTLKITARFLWG